MKKQTLLLVIAICFMTALRTGYAQSFATSPQIIVCQDKIVVNYELDSQFDNWYEVKRIIRFWRVSDGGFQAEYDLGQYFPGRNVYLDTTLGMITCYQPFPVSDTIFFGSDLDPNTQYQLSLGISGFDDIGSTSFWFNDTIATLPLSGINEPAGGITFSMYPNPANDILTLQDYEPGATISFVDLSGKVLISELSQSDKMTFDVSVFPAGVYIVQAASGRTKMAKKIIVQ